MKLVLYANRTDGAGERLHKIIEALVPEEQTEIYQTIHSLSRRLRRPKCDVAIAVILTTTKDELLEISSLKDLLGDIRVILILPDMEDETIAIGHKLRPRFLSYADGDFKDIGAVLCKILDYMQSNKVAQSGLSKNSRRPIPFGKL